MGVGLFSATQTFAFGHFPKHNFTAQQIADFKAKRQVNFEARLSDLVKNGKITEAQKQLIIAKFKDLAANRKANIAKFKSETPAQRKADRLAQKTDLQNWAKQNGIDLKLIFGGIRGHWSRK